MFLPSFLDLLASKLLLKCQWLQIGKVGCSRAVNFLGSPDDIKHRTGLCGCESQVIYQKPRLEVLRSETVKLSSKLVKILKEAVLICVTSHYNAEIQIGRILRC